MIRDVCAGGEEVVGDEALEVEVNVVDENGAVDGEVDGDGVVVMVERLPESNVTYVVGANVWTMVVRVPPMVEAKVRVIKSLAVGIVPVSSVA